MDEIDDYVRWLGKQRPVGLAWIGLAILEVAAAIFIVSEAYIRVDQHWSIQRPEINYEVIVDKLIERN